MTSTTSFSEVDLGTLHSSAPLFRWPGGKRWLAESLVRAFPERFGRYFEPFVGAGAVFFRLAPQEATLSDSNADLIACLTAVRDDPDAVIAALGAMSQGERSYYRMRDRRPRSVAGRAARFIYLTNLAFNGIYRVNRQGGFNVPYSGRLYPEIRKGDRVRLASAALRNATLLAQDFETATASAAPGDLIYFDPPYTVAHENNGFLKYNQKIFSWDDQERLSRVAANLSERGCSVIVSNAAHESIRALYRDFAELTLTRHSVVGAASASRVKTHEVLFFSWNITPEVRRQLLAQNR